MINKLKHRISEYFVGKEEITDNLLICLLSGGHILLEGVPGVGKTTLASTLAKSVDCVSAEYSSRPTHSQQMLSVRRYSI